MVAGHDVHRHASGLYLREYARKGLVAERLAVEREVAGQYQRVRLLARDLRGEGAHQLVYVQHYLAVGVRDQLGEKLPVVGERRRYVVQIRRDGDGHVALLRLVVGGRDKGKGAYEYHRREQEEYDAFFHKIHSPLPILWQTGSFVKGEK